MWKVTNELGGTAFEHGHIEGVTVLGKTGTAEVKKHHKQEDDERDVERLEPERARTRGSPAGRRPRIPRSRSSCSSSTAARGGQVAWPIAKQILEGYFTKIHPIAHAAAATCRR